MISKALDGGRITQHFPYTARCARSLFSKKTWLILGILVLVVSALWQVENYRGNRHLKQAIAPLEAHGIELDWRAYHRRAPIPPEDNVAMAPPFAELQRERTPGGGYFVAYERPIDRLLGRLPPAFRRTATPDLAGWANALNPTGHGSSAERMLAATRDFEPELEALHEAFKRPHVQWVDIDYDTLNHPPVPQLSDSKMTVTQLSAFLYARALASLEQNDPRSASRDLSLVWGFSDLGRSEPASLVGAFIRLHSNQAATEPDLLPRLLTHANWDDASLTALQTCLQPIDVLGQVDRAFRAECASSVGFWQAWVDRAPWTEELSWEIGRVIDPEPDSLWRAFQRGLWNRIYRTLPTRMPIGWRAQNGAVLAEWWDFSIYDPTSRRFLRTSAPEAEGSSLRRPVTPYNFLSQLAHPMQPMGPLTTAAMVQTRWELLQVVIGLQRYRLAHGQFPENLDLLVTRQFLDHLPTDFVTGAPPSYQLQGDRFTLASLDWERTGVPESYRCRIRLP